MSGQKEMKKFYISPQISKFTLVYENNNYNLWFEDNLIKTIENAKKPSNKIANDLMISFPKFKSDINKYPDFINEIYIAITDNADGGIDCFNVLKDLFSSVVVKDKQIINLNNASDKIKNTYTKSEMEEKSLDITNEAILELLKDNYGNSIDNINNGVTKNLYIDCDILKKYKTNKRTLYELLEVKPSTFIEDFELALLELLDNSISEYYIRFDYNGEETKIKDLLSHKLGKFIKTTGVIKGVYKVTSLLKVGVFECRSCMKLHEVEQPNGHQIIEPSICSGGCGNRSFRLLKEESKYINSRNILIEEPIEELGNNTNPRNLVVNFNGDGEFLNKINVGDRVNITGMLDNQRNERTGEFDFYIKGNNIEKIGDIDLTISEEEEKQIIELSKEPSIIYKLIKSTAPHLIIPNELKLGALCSIVGSGYVENGRSEIHSILISDPGTAKSDFFEWIISVVEKGIITSGASSSGVGLTGAIDKDPITGQNILKAGALPLASGGICIGDELDKLNKNDFGKLNNMIERGYETFSKGGINETLYCKTTFVGGANPKYERFDKYKSLKEQIDFPPSFLSRMDLIFIIQEKPDDEIIDIILNRYNGQNIEVLDNEEIIDKELMKKYLYYAKNNFNPILTEEAQKTANEYINKVMDYMNYNDIRDIVEYTASRFINSIARLSGAIAKLHLRNEILTSDVEEAIGLKNYCFNLMGYDLENNIVNVDLVSGELSKSKREQYQMIFDIINAEKENEDSVYITGQGVARAYIKSEFIANTGLSETTFNNCMKQLVKDNKLIKVDKGKQTYYDIKTNLKELI